MPTLKIDALQFPATQVPSADPNALDDYEEGTWTPVLGGDTGASGQVYSIQVGSYVKVGRQVTVWFETLLTTAGTLNGTLAAVTGLPFTSSSAFGTFAFAGTLGFATGFASNVQGASCYNAANSNYIIITGSATTGLNPLGNLAKAVIGNGTLLIGSLSYMV